MNIYFKVVVLDIGTLETTIADERHFRTRQEASAFSATATHGDRIGIVIQIGGEQ